MKQGNKHRFSDKLILYEFSMAHLVKVSVGCFAKNLNKQDGIKGVDA